MPSCRLKTSPDRFHFGILLTVSGAHDIVDTSTCTAVADAVHLRHDVEVPEEAGRDGISAAPGWAARTDKHHVDDLPELQGLAVVPDGNKRQMTSANGMHRLRWEAQFDVRAMHAGCGWCHDGNGFALGFLLIDTRYAEIFCHR